MGSLLRIEPGKLNVVYADFPYQLPAWKRVFDIIIAFILLVFLFPCFIIITFIIACEGHGPVIYRTRRMGAGLKEFTLYKFRSMQRDAAESIRHMPYVNLYDIGDNEQPVFIKVKEDSRITKIGKFIRNLHLDELPQLINVMKGDMSIVGNRPLDLEEAEKVIARYGPLRFNAPAGITGLWQVYHYSVRPVNARERVLLDHFYARKQSIWLEVWICFRTIPICLGKPAPQP